MIRLFFLIVTAFVLAGCNDSSETQTAEKNAIQEMNDARKHGAEISKKMGGRNRQIPTVVIEPDSIFNKKTASNK
jgi:uncharacterized protein YcfL